MKGIFLLILNGVLLTEAYVIDLINSDHTISKPADTYVGGINYLGIGYNLLYGNPDGSPTTGAQDPGLRPTWRVFEWTFDDGSSTPDQVVYSRSSSCAKTKRIGLFHNAYAYSSKFDIDVRLSAGTDFAFGSVKFSHSSYYQTVTSSMNVYYEEENYCHLGQARLKSELAGIDKFPLARSFVQRVNSLPETYSTNDNDYMQFIGDFGTHVVSEVTLGTKYVERYRWTRSEFVSYSVEHYSSGTSRGGSFLGYSSSIAVDTNSVKDSMTSGEALRVDKFTLLGDDDLALPYAYTLMSINEIFGADFWALHQQYVDDGILSEDFYGRLATMKTNTERALTDYPVWLNSDEAKEDPIVTVPITWPSGTYGLPRPHDGCPTTPGFAFRSGYRFHDTENDRNSNQWSSPNHFVSGSLGSNRLIQFFCMKTQGKVTNYDGDWPNGQYCVFHASTGGCPTGMSEGYIKWDDEDDDNKNRVSQLVPRGDYGVNTKLYYCCNVDGFAENAIYLPTDSPFYLFPSTRICQAVKGMDAAIEFIKWDDEDDDNRNSVGNPHPYTNGSIINHNINYCYYTPNN